MNKLLVKIASGLSLMILLGAAVKINPPAEKYEFRGDGLYIGQTTVEELQKTYQVYGYNDYLYIKDWKYPPIFLTRMPTDFNTIANQQLRNKLFLQIVGPLALKLNEALAEERLEIRLINLQFRTEHNLTPEQEKFLEEKAKKYDIFTRMKGERRYGIILDQLLMKVDKIPPSLLMGVAAIETDWGTNRPIREANSLYKELLWYSDEPGLQPEGEETDKSYKFKIFPSLYDSMASYAHKINSGVNYEQVRYLRREIAKRDQPVFGRTLAHAMIFDSNLKNFAGLLDYTITFYELINWDEAELGDIDLPPDTKT